MDKKPIPYPQVPTDDMKKRVLNRAYNTIVHVRDVVERKQSHCTAQQIASIVYRGRFVQNLGHAGVDLVWLMYTDGSEALVAVDRFEIDVVVVDTSLPDAPMKRAIGFRGDVFGEKCDV